MPVVPHKTALIECRTAAIFPCPSTATTPAEWLAPLPFGVITESIFSHAGSCIFRHKSLALSFFTRDSGERSKSGRYIFKVCQGQKERNSPARQIRMNSYRVSAEFV